jgi:hypothetical protein
MKFRIKLEGTWEFEPDMEHYPDVADVRGALQVDIDNIKDDPVAFVAEFADFKVTGEVVD